MSPFVVVCAIRWQPAGGNNAVPLTKIIKINRLIESKPFPEVNGGQKIRQKIECGQGILKRGGRHLPWLPRIERGGDCAEMRADSWRKIPQPKMFHVDTKKLSAYPEIFICMQINLPCGRDYLPQIKISVYADKFWGHFVMFPRLFINKNKICRYKYAIEQAQTKKTSHRSFEYLRICLFPKEITA
jgi:hypothetical protein